MKIYLDDERTTPEGWMRCYWPDEVIRQLETGRVTELSLDHDLGDDPRGTGYDVIVWIEQAVALQGFAPPRMHVHSANASARVKMVAGIQNIEKLARHNAQRQAEIDTLLAHLATYWRQNQTLQLHEILEHLMPNGAVQLDGPDRDDTTLLHALRAAQKARQRPNDNADPEKNISEHQLQKVAVIDTHLRRLHQAILREYHATATQLEQELQTGNASLRDYEIDATLTYFNGASTVAEQTVLLPNLVTSADLEDALQDIETDNYADPSTPYKQGFITHDVIDHGTPAAPGIGVAGLLRAERVWVDFVVTRQYCMSLESGALQGPELDT